MAVLLQAPWKDWVGLAGGFYSNIWSLREPAAHGLCWSGKIASRGEELERGEGGRAFGIKGGRAFESGEDGRMMEFRLGVFGIEREVSGSVCRGEAEEAMVAWGVLVVESGRKSGLRSGHPNEPSGCHAATRKGHICESGEE